MARLSRLLVLCLLSSAALTAAPSPPPESGDRSSWTLEADKETERSVTLQKGQLRDDVIKALGKRFGRSKNKKDPTVEILRYSRHVVGPFTQRQQMTPNGMVMMRYPLLYVDRIEVVLKNGAISNVVVKRELQASQAIFR